ncbi:hypothetical protein WG899_00060 [Paucibacter sp. AS339]|uniref:hypothetical protein n=1 Tax=Paucibacter hankyongi TaxID=3133434 RepID=UPI00309C3BB7
MTKRKPTGLLTALVLGAMSVTPAIASTDTPTPTSDESREVAPEPLVKPDKLAFLKSRIERKEKMSNPARADMPHEAVAFYVNKRTGPIITRGPSKTTGMRALDPRRYLSAAQEARKTPTYSTRQNRIMQVGREAAAAPGSALGTWTSLGPSNQGGRTRQLLIDPTNPSVMYAASVGGGVWKSLNAGADWNQLTDLVLPNIAVASLAMDPSNPQVLYAGTGEGFFNGDAIRGTGIYKSTDGGATWTALTASVPPAGVLGDFSYVTQIVVSPRSPNRVYATTRTGLFRSNDGGTSWTKLINASGVNGCQDVVLQAKRAVGYVFAACGTFAQASIYRGLDSTASSFTPVFTATNMGRTSLAIAPSNENYIYALSSNRSSYGMLGVFRSTTSGASGSWTTQVSASDPNPVNRVQLTNPVYAFSQCVGSSVGNYNQGWYDNVIAVDPIDPEKVWSGGIDLMRSDDGGRNWGVASYWWFDRGHPNYAHADNHVIRFHPNYDGGANTTMYVASDGGVFKTNNARGAVGTTVNNICGSPVAGMVQWTEMNNNYSTTQFYHGAVYPDGSAFTGGMQDNGTWRGTTASTAWQKLLGGDGGYNAVDTLGDSNPANDVLFAEYTGLSIQKSSNGGATFSDAVAGISDNGFAFIAPFHMNAGNKQHLWTGGWDIWRTTNQASNWDHASNSTPGNGSVSAVAASPSNTSRVIIGMSDGYIIYNTNALTATGSTVWPNSRPRTDYVGGIAFDPNDSNVAYAAYENFSGLSVYKTTNAGASWVAVPGAGVNVLPKVPAHTVVVDPSNSARVYVGTDIGVYTSIDGGANWYRENTGFGNVSVEHLEINSQGSPYLYAFTHGRGAWRVPLNP